MTTITPKKDKIRQGILENLVDSFPLDYNVNPIICRGALAGLKGEFEVHNIRTTTLLKLEELKELLDASRIEYERFQDGLSSPCVGFAVNLGKENQIFYNFYCPRPEIR